MREVGRSAILVVIATSAVFLILESVHTRGHRGASLRSESGYILPERTQEHPGLPDKDNRGLGLLSWWVGAIQGDFGRSQNYPGQDSVRIVLMASTVRTLCLVSGAVVVSLALSALVGLSLAGVTPPLWTRFWQFLLSGLAVVPSFVLCLAIFYLFVHSGKEPVLATAADRDYTWWLHSIIALLPILALALSDGSIPDLVATIRRESLEAKERAYYLFRQLRGQGSYGLLLRSTGIPVLGVLEGRVVHLLGTTVVVEQVFNVHGLGYAAWEAIRLHDDHVILGVTLFLGIMISLLRITARAFRSLLDPRGLGAFVP